LKDIYDPLIIKIDREKFQEAQEARKIEQKKKRRESEYSNLEINISKPDGT